MSKRLYLGRLPTDARPEDVQKHFDGYGKIIDCRVMTGFGFVEFESSRDAEDVVQAFNGKGFLGQSSIIVEFAKDTRRDRGYNDRAPPPPRVQRRPPGIRIEVSGISRDTSWQDLKDFGREAGNVSFADVDRNGLGILEYLTMEDAENAVRILDGKDLRGVPVRLTIDDVVRSTSRPPIPAVSYPNGRMQRDRRSPPRRRSRSPGYVRREERDRRRSRSPPRARYEREDYRDYRRDERREDRRDERDRYERDPRREDDREPYLNGERR